MRETESMFESAFGLHQQGKLAEAERAYHEVLRQSPDHLDATYLLGIIALQTQRGELAVACFGKAIALKPDHTEATSIAVPHWRIWAVSSRHWQITMPAIALKPDHAGAFTQSRCRVGCLGRFAEALSSYAAAITISPDSADAHDESCGRAGRNSDVGSRRWPVSTRRSRCVPSMRWRTTIAAMCCAICGDSDACRFQLRQCDRAAARPRRGTQQSWCGALPIWAVTPTRFQIMKRRSRCGQMRLKLTTTWGPCSSNSVGSRTPWRSYDQAIALQPDHAGAHKNRGAALAGLGRLDDALASCDRAIALKPNYAEAHTDRAAALTGLGRIEEALLSCDQAIALKWDSPEAQFNKGACHMALGDFERGWPGFEWRWKSRFAPEGRALPGVPWLGDVAPDNKTILVHAEQGLGDSLQFCRYIPMLAATATVVLDVPRTLVRLLSTVKGVTRIVTDGDPLPRVRRLDSDHEPAFRVSHHARDHSGSDSVFACRSRTGRGLAAAPRRLAGP